jgi:hypothetical protein
MLAGGWLGRRGEEGEGKGRRDGKMEGWMEAKENAGSLGRGGDQGRSVGVLWR